MLREEVGTNIKKTAASIIMQLFHLIKTNID